MLHGLLRPSAGAILRDGGMRQAMVFQRPFVLRMSTLSNLALALWLRGVRWGKAKELALAALARVELDVALRNARTLPAASSGWRWHAPGAWLRTCCCSTSPRPASIRTPSARSRR